MNHQKGFTLIELMIVVAIVGILASVAVPAYSYYKVSIADSSCLQEVRHYAGLAYVELIKGLNAPAPVRSACATISTPLNINSGITAMPVSPGLSPVVCSLNNGVQCQ